MMRDIFMMTLIGSCIAAVVLTFILEVVNGVVVLAFVIAVLSAIGMFVTDPGAKR